MSKLAFISSAFGSIYLRHAAATVVPPAEWPLSNCITKYPYTDDTKYLKSNAAAGLRCILFPIWTPPRSLVSYTPMSISHIDMRVRIRADAITGQVRPSLASIYPPFPSYNLTNSTRTITTSIRDMSFRIFALEHYMGLGQVVITPSNIFSNFFGLFSNSTDFRIYDMTFFMPLTLNADLFDTNSMANPKIYVNTGFFVLIRLEHAPRLVRAINVDHKLDAPFFGSPFEAGLIHSQKILFYVHNTYATKSEKLWFQPRYELLSTPGTFHTDEKTYITVLDKFQTFVR